MRLSKTAWLVLGVAVFIIGAAVIYMFYQGQAEERQEARDALKFAQDNVPILSGQKAALEAELVEREGELAQWEDTISQLEEQVVQLKITVSQNKEIFPDFLESIEYDEKLILFSVENDVQLTVLTASEPDIVSIEDIDYETASFNVEAKGLVTDILAFINTIATDSDFRTAVIGPVDIVVPEPLNEEQRGSLEEGQRAQLTMEALAEIPTGEIVRFTLEAIDEVIGNEFIDQLTNGFDGRLDARSIAHMAATIKGRITDSIYLEQNYEEPLANGLAELIAQQIASSVVGEVVASIAQPIADLVMPLEGEEVHDQAALRELLGPDMAAILGENIAGASVGNIRTLLNEYIAGLIEDKMLEAVADSVEESVESIIPGMIEEMELPSASMTIEIFSYQGEGG